MVFRRFRFALFITVFGGCVSCGPDRLPPFANPPPEDAAAHAPRDAASDDTDSGSDE